MILYFMDEAGFSNIPNVQRSWSPLSQPHAADASVGRSRVNVLGALNYGANTLEHVLHEGSVTREHIIAFIENRAQQHASSGKPIIILLDNASVHSYIDDEKIREWITKYQLLLVHIPPYSPELNLIEILWKHAKYHWREFTSWTKELLLEETDKIFCEYGNKFKIHYA